MKKTRYLLMTLFVLISSIFHAQNTTVLDNNFSIDITNVVYKKSAKASLQLVVAKKGYKIITLEVTLYSKSKKRKKLDLKQLKFVANNEDYALVTQQGLGVWKSTTGLQIKFKGEKKTRLYIQVKDTIKEGVLVFNDTNIYTISLSSKNKNGAAKPIVQ